MMSPALTVISDRDLAALVALEMGERGMRRMELINNRK